ncbi:MAG: hypothetical protein R3290_11280 [Acidimicrobiia bacterium]|nr:hypothetical protein [Acidimicrobiia bacterium]
MGWLADLIEEWRARRRGHKYASQEIRRAARDIIGPTGSQFSPGWKQLETKGDAYIRSFDPKIPPSVFVSPSDLQRRNHPVPLVERCIEDWAP